nr:hypothetical protein [Nostoc sp. ChiQUE02]MDZ8234825.1 hypothetical protein [Nostoc sp. ChiQUE02]
MQVKVLPTRLRCDSLSAHTDQTRFLEGEAGNRAQSDIRCGVTLVLTGSFYGETEPKKQPTFEAGHNIKNPTSLEIIPAAHALGSGKSPGNPVVEEATPKETNNQPRERIKTD